MVIKVEIAVKTSLSKELALNVEELVWKILQEKRARKDSIAVIPCDASYEELNVFEKNLHSITFNDIPDKLERSMVKFFYYQFSDQGPEVESIETDESSEQIAASTHW